MQVSFPYFGITVLTVRNCFAWTISVSILFFSIFFPLGCVVRLVHFPISVKLDNYLTLQTHKIFVLYVTVCVSSESNFIVQFHEQTIFATLFEGRRGDLVVFASRYPHFNLYSSYADYCLTYSWKTWCRLIVPMQQTSMQFSKLWNKMKIYVPSFINSDFNGTEERDDVRRKFSSNTYQILKLQRVLYMCNTFLLKYLHILQY